MNKEEAITKIEYLIMSNLKMLSTSECHLSDFNIEWMGKHFIREVEQADELMQYVKEHLK